MEIAKISEKAVNKAVLAIKRGGVMIFPTDTVYGFIADASNKKAAEKIFKIKKRPKRKSLPVFVKDIKMAKKLAIINKECEKTLKKYWPGKYTFILERKKGINLYGIDKNTIALRIPDYKPLNSLLKKINRPLVQTSANISGKPALNKIGEIVKEFGIQKNKPDLIIDAGNLPKRKPSKIIDLTGKNKKIIR